MMLMITIITEVLDIVNCFRL